MPKVPTFESNRGTDVLGSNTSVPGATPAAFGAGIGSALQSAGGTIQQVGSQLAQTALTIQADTNRLDTTNALLDANKQLTDFQYNPETGLFSQFGINAKGSGDRLEKEIDRIGNITAASLANPKQKELFLANFARTTNAARGRTLRHESSQMRAASISSLSVIVDNTAEAVYLDPDSNTTIVNALEEMEIATAAISRLSGDTPEVADVRREAAESRIHGSVVDRYLQDGRTQDAKEYFEANKDNIDAESQRNLSGGIKRASDRDEAVITATGYADTYGRDLSSGMVAIAQDIKDPVLRRKVSLEFSQQSALLSNANLASLKAAYEVVDKTLTREPTIANAIKVLEDIQDGSIDTTAANLSALRNRATLIVNGPKPTVEGQARQDALHTDALAAFVLNAVESGGTVQMLTNQVDDAGNTLVDGRGNPLTENAELTQELLSKVMDEADVSADVRASINTLFANEGYSTSFSDIQSVYNIALGLPEGETLGEAHAGLVSGVVAKLATVKDPTDAQILEAMKPFLHKFHVSIPFGRNKTKTLSELINAGTDLSTVQRVELTPLEDANLETKIRTFNEQQASLARADSSYKPEFVENTATNRAKLATIQELEGLAGGEQALGITLSLDTPRGSAFLSDLAEEHAQTQRFFKAAASERINRWALQIGRGLPEGASLPPVDQAKLDAFDRIDSIDIDDLRGMSLDEVLDQIGLDE